MNFWLKFIKLVLACILQNQFFISCRKDPQVHNAITEALFRRILRAHQAKKKFRVYIIMPLIPGFEGDIRSVYAEEIDIYCANNNAPAVLANILMAS